MPRTPPRNSTRTSPRNSTRTSPRTSREQPVARERRRRHRARPAFGGGPTSKTLSYDAAGNLPHPWVGDGQDYEYVYDAWHRLVRIEVRSSGDIVSEHRYYGNGFRAGERYDSNEDGRVNSLDKWYWFGYDERWRIVGTFRDSDSSPKERFLHHVAGMGGYGSSSYIDGLVLRDRDANTDWNDDASDGTLEERVYYCQNWRHDVVALVTSGGALRERVRYTAYGIPVGMPQGDCDGDGDVDAADQSILLGAWGTSTAKCDLNLDGTVDATDNAILLGQLGATAGFGRLSLSGNRFGYAGYASDPAVHADWHVRHRVLMAELGRWSRRDPIGYVDSSSQLEYVKSGPVLWLDHSGLFASIFFLPEQGLLGDCGYFACFNDVAIMNGPFPLYRSWLVGHVQRELYAWCCEPEVERTDRDGFYEKWGDVARLRPFEFRIVTTHYLSDSSKKCTHLLRDRRWVESARLIVQDPERHWTPGSRNWAELCSGGEGMPWDWSINPEWSDLPPPGWNQAVGKNINSQQSDFTFWGCCGGRLGRSGKCTPDVGVEITDLGPTPNCGCGLSGSRP